MKEPKKLLTTKDRKEMWKEAKLMLTKVDKALGISEAYIVGSFASNKKRPADIDFAIVTKVKKKSSAWPIDFLILPESGENTKVYLNDMKKWMKKRYGERVDIVKLK